MAFTARTETYARGSSLVSPYNFTINKATGTVDGDIMFMFLAIYLAGTPPTIDSVPSGWTQVATNTTTYSRWYLYYKIASGEGSSYTWSLTASCRYYALNIAYSSGDFDVQSIDDITAISNTLYPTAGTTVRAASMSVPDANSPLVYFGAIYNTTVRTFTKPNAPTTDWIEDADEGSTTPDLSLTIGSMIWTGSGATGNMDIVCSITITTYKHAFAIALKPKTIVIIEGTSSGSGNGLSSSTSLLYVLGASAVSGAGLANSLGILDVFGVASASGNGLASSSGVLYVLTLVSGQGAGLGIATGDAFPPYEIVEGIASGSGMGLGGSLALLDILAQAEASGIGIGSSLAYLDISGQASAAGDGLATALAYLEITGQAYGEGAGLASAVGAVLVIIEGLAEGSGTGQGELQSFVLVLSDSIGSGIGSGESYSFVGSQELYDLFNAYEEEFMECLTILQDIQPKINALPNTVWDEQLTGATHNIPTSAGRRLRQMEAFVARNDNCQGGSADTITLDTGASSITDYYKPGLIIHKPDAGDYQFARIISYDGDSKIATVASDWGTIPLNGEEFWIMPWASVRVSEVETGISVLTEEESNKLAEISIVKTQVDNVKSDTGDLQIQVAEVQYQVANVQETSDSIHPELIEQHGAGSWEKSIEFKEE